MTRWILAPRQARPKRCMECHEFFFMQANDAMVIPWLIEGEPRWYGRVLFYYYVCVPCYAALPEKIRRRAIEPGKTDAAIAERQRRRAAHWHRELPIERLPAATRVLDRAPALANADRLDRCACGRTKYKTAARCGSCAAQQRAAVRKQARAVSLPVERTRDVFVSFVAAERAERSNGQDTL